MRRAVARLTHTDAVSVPGWTGAGYIILDPDTGSGAYKISGGGNGSFEAMIAGGESGVLLFGTIIGAAAGFGTLLGAFFLIAALIDLALILYYETLDTANCFNTGLTNGIGLAMEVAGGAPKGVGFILGLFLQWKISADPIATCLMIILNK